MILLKKAILILFLSCMLTGCQPKKATNVQAHVVTEITITCQTYNDWVHRYYNTPKKMQNILLYLRAVSPGFAPNENPETVPGRMIYITLQRADGTTKIYRQKNERYLQEGSNPWRQINADWGASLYQLVLSNESDPQPGREAYRPLPGSWRYHRFVKHVTGRTL